MRKAVKRTTTLVAAAMVLGLAAQAAAVEFKRFRKVENVCPDCEKEKSDEVTLADGNTIRCNIVAANEDFLVLEKYGEVRAVPNSQVESRSFADGSPPSDLRSQDQIVLEDGHVLTGKIVDESQKPGHYQLKSAFNDSSFVVFKSEAKALYRDGSKKTIEMPESGSDSSSSGSSM